MQKVNFVLTETFQSHTEQAKKEAIQKIVDELFLMKIRYGGLHSEKSKSSS